VIVTVLCVLIVLGSTVALGLAGLRMWRTTVALGRAVGRAGEAVTAATEGLERGLGARQPSAPGPPGRPPGAPTGDGARLAARVGRQRGAVGEGPTARFGVP
jgi:hypothetical protein